MYSIIIWIIFSIGFISFGCIEWFRIKKCRTVEEMNVYFHGKKTKHRNDTKEKMPRTNMLTWIMLTVGIVLLVSMIGYFTKIYRESFLTDNMLDFLIMTVSSFASMVTFMGVIRTFEKHTYILYSVQTIARQCFLATKIKCIVVIILIELVIYIVSFFAVSMSEMVSFVLGICMLACFVWYIALFANLILEFVDILFGTENEHRILKRLYRELWYTEESKLKAKKSKEDKEEYRKDGIAENVDFLIEGFLKAARKIDFGKIKDIRFLTFLCPKTEVYKEARKKGVRNVILFMMIYIGIFRISDWVVNVESALNGILLDIVCIFTLLILGYKIRYFSSALISIFYWCKGYYISYEQRKLVISELMMFSNNKWCRFFISIKNLVTYIIILKNSGEKIDEIISALLNRCIDDKELLIVLQVIKGLELSEVNYTKQDDEIESYQMISNAIVSDIRM